MALPQVRKSSDVGRQQRMTKDQKERLDHIHQRYEIFEKTMQFDEGGYVAIYTAL